jgi:hypothetical protein
MRLELTDREVRVLIQVLEERLRELRLEIIHTSTHDYKIILKDRERVLQCLHDKLVTCYFVDAA